MSLVLGVFGQTSGDEKQNCVFSAQHFSHLVAYPVIVSAIQLFYVVPVAAKQMHDLRVVILSVQVKGHYVYFAAEVLVVAPAWIPVDRLPGDVSANFQEVLPHLTWDRVCSYRRDLYDCKLFLVFVIHVEPFPLSKASHELQSY